MHESPERVDEFKSEIAAMQLRDPSTARDRVLTRAGAALLAAGIVVGIASYFMSHGTSNELQQRDAIVLALIGLSVTVAGAALFVRGSLAAFLRFWMARLSYEQAAQTDRVVQALSEQEPANPAKKD